MRCGELMFCILALHLRFPFFCHRMNACLLFLSMTLSLDGYFMLEFASSLLFIVFFSLWFMRNRGGLLGFHYQLTFMVRRFPFFFKILHGVVWLLNEVLSREEIETQGNPFAL
jgi:hypothetical protein